jgi:hypothetical protein
VDVNASWGEAVEIVAGGRMRRVLVLVSPGWYYVLVQSRSTGSDPSQAGTIDVYETTPGDVFSGVIPPQDDYRSASVGLFFLPALVEVLTIEIECNPAGMTLYVDAVALGETPTQVFPFTA